MTGRLESFIAATPCFILAGTLAITWIDPLRVDAGSWVKFGVAIMVLEFILVHSGGMMASMLSDKDEQANWNQLKLLTGATLFYAIFVAAMAFSFNSWTLFYIFTAVMISRWISF